MRELISSLTDSEKLAMRIIQDVGREQFRSLSFIEQLESVIIPEINKCRTKGIELTMSDFEKAFEIAEYAHKHVIPNFSHDLDGRPYQNPTNERIRKANLLTDEFKKKFRDWFGGFQA